MAWTRFMDMHSGGRNKVADHEYLYIEAPRLKAVAIFSHRFGRNPYNTTCGCCGKDYSINEYETLEDATRYNRTPWPAKKNPVIELDAYLAKEGSTVLVLRDSDLTETERELPDAQEHDWYGFYDDDDDDW